MKIGDYIVLTKQKDKKYKGNHPNFINVGSTEIQGYIKELPIIGEQFYLFPSMKLVEPQAWTSKVEKVTDTEIHTKNSIYTFKIHK